MRTWVKPQFWQSFSTLTPGWKFSPSAREHALTWSKILLLTTLTSTGLLRRFCSLLLPVTTTCSSMKASGVTSKFISRVRPCSMATSFCMVL